MNILIAPNDYYIFPSMVLLRSLFDNTPLQEGDSWQVYILQEGVTPNLLRQLSQFIEGNGGFFHVVEIPAGAFDQAPISIHITKSTYYRLLAPFLLPREMERILYLDGDMVTIRAIQEFYQTPFLGQEALVVCEGPGVSQKDFATYDRIGLSRERLYFNGGVLLMNLPKMREILQTPQRLFDFIAAQIPKGLKYHDQDVLNAMFQNHVQYVDWHRWNQTVIHIQDAQEAAARFQQAAILHYAGSSKPWQYNYSSWYFNEFWNVARKLSGGRRRYWKIMLLRYVWHLTNRMKRLFL